MAVLNYAKTYQEVLNELGVSHVKDLTENTSGNYVKLFFTGDGNITTHGVDFLPIFTLSFTGKGLVPINTSTENKNKDFLRGDATWAQISTLDLPIWVQGNPYDSDTILNSEQVNLLVQQSFIANDAMRFKGVISSSADIESPWKVGDTYRVNTGGATNVTIYEHVCLIGDLLICILEGDSSVEYPRTYWAVVLTNINGTNSIKINNSTLKFYTDDLSSTFTGIYAPTTNGYGEQKILVTALSSTGSPIWAGLSEGLNLVEIGNGKTLTLNKATISTLGGVKIDNLGKTSDKMTSGNTISITSEGNIYLTATNISNALGFMPTNPDDLQDALTRADSTKDGLAPMFNVSKGEILNNSWILGVDPSGNSDSYGWYNIPATAFSDTWRKIVIGGVDIEDSELHLNPSGDVCIEFDNNPADDIVSISFGLSWWNISANGGLGAYEKA